MTSDRLVCPPEVHPIVCVNNPSLMVKESELAAGTYPKTETIYYWPVIYIAAAMVILGDKQLQGAAKAGVRKGIAAGRKAYPHVKRAAVWTAKEIDAKIKSIIAHYQEQKHPPLSSVGSAYKEDIILRIVTEEMVKKDPTTTYTEVIKVIRKNLYSDPNYYEAMIRRYRGK